MKLFFALVLYTLPAPWVNAEDLFEQVALAAQNQMGLLEAVDWDTGCGDDCCLAADAIGTLDKYRAFVNPGEPDSNGKCTFHESLYDEIMSDPVVLTSLYIRTITLPKSVLKGILKKALEHCTVQVYDDTPVTPVAFPGGSRAIMYPTNTWNTTPLRSTFTLDKDCKIAMISGNYESCYAGCAGIVTRCPISFPYPSANQTQAEIDGLYDAYMCFNTQEPPEDVSFTDLGLCEDGSDDDSDDDSDDQDDDDQAQGGAGKVSASGGAPVP